MACYSQPFVVVIFSFPRCKRYFQHLRNLILRGKIALQCRLLLLYSSQLNLRTSRGERIKELGNSVVSLISWN